LSNESTDYVVGGLLAFGIANASISIVDALVNMEIISTSYSLRLFEGLLVYVVASLISGYIIANRNRTSKIQESIKSGWFAFFLNAVLMLYYRTFFGLIWILIGYSVGGLVGGFLSQLINTSLTEEYQNVELEE
jgi:hypothetical protein